MDKLIQLENRIKELEKWKTEKTRQQITFPLDNQSIDILNKYFLSIYQVVEYYLGDAVDGYELMTHYLTKQDNKYVDLDKSKLIPYTIDLNTDYLTISSGVNFTDNFVILFATTGTQSTSINTALSYYVVNPTSGQRFQISETPGGSPVHFTDIGTGNQFIRTYTNQIV